MFNFILFTFDFDSFAIFVRSNFEQNQFYRPFNCFSKFNNGLKKQEREFLICHVLQLETTIISQKGFQSVMYGSFESDHCKVDKKRGFLVRILSCSVFFVLFYVFLDGHYLPWPLSGQLLRN